MMMSFEKKNLPQGQAGKAAGAGGAHLDLAVFLSRLDEVFHRLVGRLGVDADDDGALDGDDDGFKIIKAEGR